MKEGERKLPKTYRTQSMSYNMWLLFLQLQDSGQRKQCRNLVYKFLFIPVIFLVLRMWTCVLIILYIYINLHEKQVPRGINIALLYLSVSII